jgi:hypothetical protein
LLFDDNNEPASFCTRCGRRFLEAERFCPQDGNARVVPQAGAAGRAGGW